jgi:diguanylate cyclase (GGDEF)-like protein
MSGFEVCASLKADKALNEVPVIFVTSHSDLEFEVSGFDVGAADFIAKPISVPLVLARVRSQLRAKRMSDELRRVSTVDPLTGVANRRRFDETFDREWLRARRHSEALSLLMIDIDHFKLYNDRYGHVAGDDCLKSIAQVMGDASHRSADLFARFGGEEFALLLPQTPRAGAAQVALRVLESVAALGVAHAASPTSAVVSVSIGIACYDDASPFWVDVGPDSRVGGETRDRCQAIDLLKAADTAMYAAKTAGRAQAMLLDVADGQTPAAVQPVRRPRVYRAEARMF